MAHRLVVASAFLLVTFSVVAAQDQQPADGVQAPVDTTSDSPAVGYYKAHGASMWLAFGLFFPAGILISKYGQKSLGAWFHLHWITQVIGTAAATVGVTIALKKFNALVDSTHAKLGLALVILVWLQLLLAVSRPRKGDVGRTVWYFVHWLSGTGSVILGWYNIFRGLYLYEEDFSKISVGVYIAFAVQVAFLSFIYLFLEKYNHLRSQGQDQKAVELKQNGATTIV